MSVVVAIAILWLQEKSKVAKRVETFNRQTTESWSISQIMGPRNTAGFGDISTAWASRSPDSGPEWVIAEFPNEIEATSLEIHESNSPGAVTKVLSVSMTGAESLLWEGKDPLSSGGLAGGISKISFSKPTKTRRVKIVIDSARYPGYNEIDAIALVEGNVNRQWCSQAWASSSYGTNRTAPNWYWP